MKIPFILLTIAYVLLFAAFVVAFPYTKKGYDQSVLEEYGAMVTANMGDLK